MRMWLCVWIWCMSMSLCTRVIQDIHDSVLLWPWPEIVPLRMKNCWSMVADGRIQSTKIMWHICTAWRMRYFRLIVNRRKESRKQKTESGKWTVNKRFFRIRSNKCEILLTFLKYASEPDNLKWLPMTHNDLVNKNRQLLNDNRSFYY